VTGVCVGALEEAGCAVGGWNPLPGVEGDLGGFQLVYSTAVVHPNCWTVGGADFRFHAVLELGAQPPTYRGCARTVLPLLGTVGVTHPHYLPPWRPHTYHRSVGHYPPRIAPRGRLGTPPPHPDMPGTLHASQH